MHTPHSIQRGFVALAAAFSVVATVAAQTAPATNSGAAVAPPPAEAVQLSPFTVSTDKEQGYSASGTLAGTRLNTALRDIAAAVTVITPDFMADLGVNTLQEVIDFTVNAEVNVANFNAMNQTPSSVRIRGVAITSNTQDFFRTFLPPDIYNLDQISVNRGPNSLLFGVGNPAGTLTGVAKRAAFTRRAEVAASVDHWGGWRFTTDLNQPIVPGRAALRVAALRRDARQSIEPAFVDESRLYLAGTAVLSQRRHWRTSFHANAEWSDTDQVHAALVTATDVITPWLNSGAPLVDGVRGAANAATLPLGTVRAAGANQIVVIDGSPTAVPILNWLNTARGGLVNYENRALSDRGPVPYRLNYDGPTRSSNYKANNFTFFLEQELGPATALELAYCQSESDRDWIRSGGSGGSLSVDVNRLLPNGAPNPNVGKFYYQDTSRVQKQYSLNRQLRLTASHTADLRPLHRWLGTHRAGALLSRDFNTFALDDLYEANSTPLPGFATAINNAQNRIVRRSYLFLGRGDVWLADQKFHTLAPINTDGVRSRYYNDRVLRLNAHTDSAVLGLQSRLIKERLVTTFGYRWDELESFALDPARAVRRPDGEFNPWRTYPLEARAGSRLENGTATLGAVFHVLPQLSLSANQSETAGTGGVGLVDMYGRTLPIPMGVGKDYGIKFALLGGRLTGSLTRYRSAQENQSTSAYQSLGIRISQIGQTLNLPLLAAVTDPRDTLDIVSTGYELELVFNPAPAWRIAANVSNNDNLLSNVNSRGARFLEENVFPLEPRFGAVVLPNGRTVAQEIADFRVNVRNSKTSQEGSRAAVLREWNGSILTNYRFAEGRLKGFSLGGNVLHRGPSIIGARVDPVTNLPDFAAPLKGNGYTLLGLHVRYERRLFRRYAWQASLHVRNVLDENRLIEKDRSSADGAVLSYDRQEPRSWTLSSSVAF
jgi:hypothetical protein